MVAIPFIGPTYQSRSLTLDAQRTINLYVEEDEGQGGKAPAALYATPGEPERYVLPVGPIRGMWTSRSTDRVFAVASDRLYERQMSWFHSAAASLRADAAAEVFRGGRLIELI